MNYEVTLRLITEPDCEIVGGGKEQDSDLRKIQNPLDGVAYIECTFEAATGIKQ